MSLDQHAEVVVELQQDQSFGLTSKQGVFVGIARYKKDLGYIVSDGRSTFVTRDYITFDPQLFPFKLKPTTSPDWQTFCNLTNPVAEGAVTQTPTSSTTTDPMPDSDESDLDPEFDSSKNPESADIHDTPTYESSSEDEQMDNDSSAAQTQEEPPISMTRSSRARQPV